MYWSEDKICAEFIHTEWFFDTSSPCNYFWKKLCDNTTNSFPSLLQNSLCDVAANFTNI